MIKHPPRRVPLKHEGVPNPRFLRESWGFLPLAIAGDPCRLAPLTSPRRVWEEGGYKGGYWGEFGLPAMRSSGDVEDRITAGVRQLVQQVQQAK